MSEKNEEIEDLGSKNADFIKDQDEINKRIEKIKNKIMVLSGKGGVGKSTIAANLAVGLALNGNKVGLLDIDIHGPSIPKLLNLEDRKLFTAENLIQPIEFSENLRIVSIAFLLQGDDDAIVWRGPLKYSLIDGSHKVIRYASGDVIGLYDLKDDPDESQSLEAEDPLRFRLMSEELSRLIEETERIDSRQVDVSEPDEQDLKDLRSLGYAE